MNTILTDDEREEIFQRCADADEEVVDRYGRAIEAAVLAKLREQEPVAWLVCSINKDGSPSLEYAAAWKDAAHEHINDAITEHEIEDAASWVVRPAYAAPLPAVVQMPQGLIEAVDRVLEEAHCDCPHRLRADDGEHLSGRPLFDLNVARLKMLAAAPEAPAQGEAYTYASKQATMCAECGEHKHTPLRIDAMGGYVCLTCIDRKLGSMLGEFGYPEAQAIPAPWREVVKVAREALRACDLRLTHLSQNSASVVTELKQTRAALAQLDALEGGG